jgi:hypothetical protein
MDTKKPKEAMEHTTTQYTDKVIPRCIYNEICSKDKLCGDCGIDLYESDQYEAAVENFNLDRKMKLNSHR